MKEAVKTASAARSRIKIIPDRFEKVYFNWIENLRDWCISRQIWYGHRIPVWYRNKEQGGRSKRRRKERGTVYVGTRSQLANMAKRRMEPGRRHPRHLVLFRPVDVLDARLAGRERIRRSTRYHPTTILETGSDILFFWVARMILMSTYLSNEVPFKTVYLARPCPRYEESQDRQVSRQQHRPAGHDSQIRRRCGAHVAHRRRRPGQRQQDRRAER